MRVGGMRSSTRSLSRRPGVRQHRHARPITEPVAGERRQSGRLLGALRHGSGKPQPARVPIRRRSRRVPVRLDIDGHVHEFVSVRVLAATLTSPRPDPVRRAEGGRRGVREAFGSAARRRLVRLGLGAESRRRRRTAHRIRRSEARPAARRSAAGTRNGARRGRARYVRGIARRSFRCCLPSTTTARYPLAPEWPAGPACPKPAEPGRWTYRPTRQGPPTRRIPPRTPPGQRKAIGRVPPARTARTTPPCERPSSRERRPTPVTGRGSQTGVRWPRRWRTEKRETASHPDRAARRAVGRNPGCRSSTVPPVHPARRCPGQSRRLALPQRMFRRRQSGSAVRAPPPGP